MRWQGAGCLVAVLALCGLAGCGSTADPEVSRARFEARMQEEHGADAAQALCITGYVYDDYDDSAIETIYQDGIAALSPSLWDPYFHSVVGCLADT